MKVQIYRAALKRAGVVTVKDSRVQSAPAAARVVHAMTEDACGERVVVVYLNGACEIIGTECVSSGGLSGASITPAEVFRGALLACARAIVLGHNHPSGDPTPSHDDVEMTRKVARVGADLGIDVVDHVVVTRDGNFRSLRELGVL